MDMRDGVVLTERHKKDRRKPVRGTLIVTLGLLPAANSLTNLAALIIIGGSALHLAIVWHIERCDEFYVNFALVQPNRLTIMMLRSISA